MGEIKPSFDTNRQVLGKIYPLAVPFTVILDASEMCNFRCSYCFRGSDDMSKWGYAANQRLMDEDVFKMAVDQILEFPENPKVISLSNHGEPLCNKKIPEMVRYIKEKGIKSRISIHTNASLLKGEYAKELAESGIDRVVVSLQGMTTKKYHDICATGTTYDVILENIKDFSKYKKNTLLCVKVVDCALDEGEEKKFYDTFLPIADRVFIEKVVPIWKGISVTEENSKHEFENKCGFIFTEQSICPLCFNTIVVGIDGDVYPCTQLLSDVVLGNVKEQSLLNMWNGEVRTEFLKKQLIMQQPDMCKGCYIKDNSIQTKEDLVDDFREEILMRLEAKSL